MSIRVIPCLRVGAVLYREGQDMVLADSTGQLQDLRIERISGNTLHALAADGTRLTTDHARLLELIAA